MKTVDLFGDQVLPTAHKSTLGENWDYPPFSVLNAREGWWQERKRAWLSLGIKSELGRGDVGGKGSPGGSLMPSCDYSERKRGNGKGQAIG